MCSTNTTAQYCRPPTFARDRSTEPSSSSPLRVWLRTGHVRGYSELDARSHNNLNSSDFVHRAPRQLSQSIRPSRPFMEIVSATSAIVGLAVPVFQSAKALRDRIKLVRYPPHPLGTLRALIIIIYPCSQVASEKAELLAALTEYEKDINALESLYNDNKELLDQHKLDTDLRELAE